ncbi:MAG TPA: DUF1631 family protein [Ramlibacter sp.]|uniref:DUF1631 family protein n=1 Tax=Ramlibacter sp. TaxID=1917967 RepID=UPI002BE90848|nr:DUF1631 family protein [Ramlibacter sp.]HVZ42235.1 DUF1631 family protein [Ramlibacter sp.]
MPLPAVLHACFDDAVARALAMVQQASEHAENALEEERRRLDNPLDRQEYTAALHELALQRLSWGARFPQVLRDALLKPPRKSPATLTIRPSSLSLVDDGELMQSIETSRLTQQLAAAVEQPLCELDTLMSSALGLEGVHPEENPLRPEVFAQALRTVLGECQPPPRWPAIWMRHMARPIGAHLVELYRSAAARLKQARVEAAAYRVVTAPAPLARASQPMPMHSQPMPLAERSHPTPMQSHPMPLHVQPHRGPMQSQRQVTAPSQSRHDAQMGAASPARRYTASGFVELITQALRGPLFADFLFRGSAQEQHALEPSYYHRVEHEVAELERSWDEAPPDSAALQARAALPAVERPVREVGTDSPLSREVWGALAAPRQRKLVRARLKQQANNVGQVLGLEVVHQLLDQVARDDRLLAPVREAIVALEPSLARLALKSPRFFGAAEHPARKLVARVAQRSFHYNDEFSPQFKTFFDEISTSFRALNELEALADDTPFADQLRSLETAWDAQDREQEAQRAKLLEAVQFAERRQQEAGQIAWTLGQRSDLEGAPAAVQDFLFDRWSLVMAHARLKAGGQEIDPGGFGAVITDLLWTVKRDTVLKDPARAFELIPPVLAKLRAGLDLLGEAPGDNDEFFAALERLHRPVMKLRARHRKQAFEIPSEILPEPELACGEPQASPRQGDGLWLTRGELQNVGFGDTLPSDFAQLPAEAQVQPAHASLEPARNVAPGPLDTQRADALIALLQVGSWVDLFSRQEWLRARLTWTSTNSAFFMFESHGGLPHSMTRRSLQRLVMNRLLRPIEGHEVVQHAIDRLSRAEPQALAA